MAGLASGSARPRVLPSTALRQFVPPRKGRATCRVTAGQDGVNKERKPILLRRLYFTETRGEVIGVATTVAEWFPMQTMNYYIYIPNQVVEAPTVEAF